MVEVPDIGFLPTVPVFLRRLASRWGERDFVVTPDERMSFAELERTTRRVGKELLAGGVVKGTRLAFMYGNDADFVVIWLAAARIGADAMPLSTLYKPAELVRVLRIADVEIVVSPPTLFERDQATFIESAVPLGPTDRTPLRIPTAPYLRRILLSGPSERPWADAIDLRRGRGGDHAQISEEFFEAVESAVHPGDPMFTVFTSGTTAEPKAVIHSHGTWIRHGSNVADCADEPEEDVIFGGMPFFWIGGLSTTLGTAMHRGTTVVCTEKADPSVAARLIAAERPSRILMWPTARQRLVETLMADGVDPATVPALNAPAPGPGATSQLGMTETCAAYIVNGPRHHVVPDEFRGAHGLAVRHMEYRVADLETGEVLGEGEEGEILVRGYSLMLGMHKKERHEIFEDDGWYHTGDKGVLRGPYIFFTGRAKDLIKASGANVAPREVEAALTAEPAVLQVVVLGVPDAERGEVVGAVLIPRDRSTFDPDGVIAAAGETLSSYKIPRRYVVLEPDELPVLPTGKPDLDALRKRLIAEGTPR